MSSHIINPYTIDPKIKEKYLNLVKEIDKLSEKIYTLQREVEDIVSKGGIKFRPEELLQAGITEVPEFESNNNIQLKICNIEKGYILNVAMWFVRSRDGGMIDIRLWKHAADPADYLLEYPPSAGPLQAMALLLLTMGQERDRFLKLIHKLIDMIIYEISPAITRDTVKKLEKIRDILQEIYRLMARAYEALPIIL